MPDDYDTPHRRATDHRIDRIEIALEKLAEKLEQVAVLIVQGQHHDERISELEKRVNDLRIKDAEQNQMLHNGERLLWAVGAIVLAGGQEILDWVRHVFAGPSE